MSSFDYIFYLLEDIALYNQISSIKQTASSFSRKRRFLDENYDMWVELRH